MALSSASSYAAAPDGPARVLVIFSGHRLVPAALAAEQELRAVLDTGSPRPVEYYYEAVERASAHQWPYTLATRNKLIEAGTLAPGGDALKFTRDAEFSSSSAAATVVQGGSANGLLAWKDREGKTLKELEAV